jgi:hypothetical protein
VYSAGVAVRATHPLNPSKVPGLYWFSMGEVRSSIWFEESGSCDLQVVALTGRVGRGILFYSARRISLPPRPAAFGPPFRQRKFCHDANREFRTTEDSRDETAHIWAA